MPRLGGPGPRARPAVPASVAAPRIASEAHLGSPIFSHITESQGHKSRKSSLIVLSWLAIDRHQAINNTQEGGRKGWDAFIFKPDFRES